MQDVVDFITAEASCSLLCQRCYDNINDTLILLLGAHDHPLAMSINVYCTKPSHLLQTKTHLDFYGSGTQGTFRRSAHITATICITLQFVG